MARPNFKQTMIIPFICKFKCDRCNFLEETPNHKSGVCVNCGHDYVQWLNYHEWREWYDGQQILKLIR